MSERFIPRYASAAGIKEWYGISYPRLQRFVTEGFVKSIKLGNSKQSGRLYSMSDVEESLERLAVGRRPKLSKESHGAR